MEIGLMVVVVEVEEVGIVGIGGQKSKTRRGAEPQRTQQRSQQRSEAKRMS
jgi:hypothetical protein